LKYGTISSAEENIGSLLNKLLPYLGKKIVQFHIEDDDTKEILLDDIIVDGINLSLEYRTLLLSNESNQAFLQRLSSKQTFSDTCCSRFVEIIGGKSVKSRKSNISTIKEWMICESAEKKVCSHE